MKNVATNANRYSCVSLRKSGKHADHNRCDEGRHEADDEATRDQTRLTTARPNRPAGRKTSTRSKSASATGRRKSGEIWPGK